MGKYKIKAKILLLKYTVIVTAAFLVSFLLQILCIAFPFAGVYLFVSGDLLEALTNRYNNTIVLTVFVTAVSLSVFFGFALFSALKMGESLFLKNYSSTHTPTFTDIFKFLHPTKAFSCFAFHCRLTALKTGWLLYYTTPVGLCFLMVQYLKSFSALPDLSFKILETGLILFFWFAFFMWRFTLLRYSAAGFLFIEEKTSPKIAIQKSTLITDSFLLNEAALNISFFPWFMSCIFILPLFYVIPYYRLTKALFTAEISEDMIAEKVM